MLLYFHDEEHKRDLPGAIDELRPRLEGEAACIPRRVQAHTGQYQRLLPYLRELLKARSDPQSS